MSQTFQDIYAHFLEVFARGSYPQFIVNINKCGRSSYGLYKKSKCMMMSRLRQINQQTNIIKTSNEVKPQTMKVLKSVLKMIKKNFRGAKICHWYITKCCPIPTFWSPCSLHSNTTRWHQSMRVQGLRLSGGTLGLGCSLTVWLHVPSSSGASTSPDPFSCFSSPVH